MRRWVILFVALVVIAFVLPPLINLKSYQHRITSSIGRSIGRQVHASSVRLRLLPLPGLEFSDFTVEEDPQFGTEPTLYSSSVVANLRLLSLWRGKLEVSRIHFDDASLNLVREPHGEGWNVASVMVQAAHISNAPTGQRFAGPSPRFPYIEAENTRINFKQANEKKPLSFLNSELSISLDPGDEWEVHFQAQPVRTDLDLSLADTGLLRIDGTLRRAGVMSAMPLNLKVDWTGVPLGQLSRLTLAHDIGWRGGVEVQAQILGTADLAQIRSKITVAGFHRSEFSASHPLDLATTCQGVFKKASRSVEDLSCNSPVGDGALRLTGSIQEAPGLPESDLALEIDQVPASAALSVLQEVRKGLAAGVQATGSLNGHFQYTAQNGRPPSIAGEMGLSSLSLSPSGSGKPFLLAPVRLQWDNPPPGQGSAPALWLRPTRVAMGGPAPVTVDGHFTLTGFELHLNGAASVARLQQFNRGFGLLGPAMTALGDEGTAVSDLDLRGQWLLPVPEPDHPVAASTAEGSLALHNAELKAPYLSQPLRVVSAQAILSPTQVAWTNASISYGHLEGQATLEYPTLCGGNVVCAGHFSLVTPGLDLGALQATLLGTSEGGELLRQFLNRIDSSSVSWPNLSGTVQTAELSVGKLTVHDAVTAVDVGDHAIRIRSLNGRVGNGMLHLAGQVRAAGGKPQYQLETEVTNAAPNTFASIFDERWGGGTVSFSAQVKMSGFDADDLSDSATGTLHWNWSKGGLAAQPFTQFDQWTADTAIEDKTVKLTHSLLTRGNSAIPLSGIISFDRELDLKAGSAGDAVAITGTLEHPQSTPLNQDAEK